MRLGFIVRTLVALSVAGLAIGYVLTEPAWVAQDPLPFRTPDLANGQTMFDIGGCTHCHATPGQDDRLRLGGGLALDTPFGTFKMPNISSDPGAGLGAWTEVQFVNAMLAGIGRKGEHLFPAFPYASYQRMPVDDVRDLYAVLKTVPPDPTASQSHQLPLPFSIRRGVGAWKLLFMDGRPFVADPAKDAAHNRGAYLVEGPGHCAECHSRRNILGGIVPTGRFAGGPGATGTGWVPNITPHQDGLAEWSLRDMESFLQTGLAPAGYPVEGEMAAIIANTSKLSPADRSAIAAYLNSLPARPGKRPSKTP